MAKKVFTVYRTHHGPQARGQDALVETDAPLHLAAVALCLDIGHRGRVCARGDGVLGVIEHVDLDTEVRRQRVDECGDRAVA